MNTVRSFRVDSELLKKIKILCVRRNITIMQFVSEALIRYYKELINKDLKTEE